MKITSALLGEHGAIYMVMDQLSRIMQDSEAQHKCEGAITIFLEIVDAHARMEEEYFFPELETIPNMKSGPLAVMRREHSEMDTLLAEIDCATNLAEKIALVEQSFDMIYGHFIKEEQVLFPMAEQFLSDAKLDQMGANWGLHRGVAVMIG